MRKSIFTAASPNTQFDDALLAFSLIVTPWRWGNEKYNLKFEEELKDYLKVPQVSLIDSCRSGIYITLKALGISKNDEILVPSFTCVVVANSVNWIATPIYMETREQDFNADYENLSKYITERTKAIIVQHTFGKMVSVDSIRNELKKINRSDIKIIEDFAHTVSDKFELKGDAGVLTFGIEKVLSSVRGGAIVTNNSELGSKIEQEISKLPKFPNGRTFISLANPIFWFFAIPLHSVGIGRYTIGAFIRGIWRKLGFLGIMVEEEENHAIKPDWFPGKMSPALSKLGLKQLSKLNMYNAHRTKIAKIYHEHLSQISDDSSFDEERVYLRYPILLKDESETLKVWNLSRALRVTLGNWFSSPLYGNSVDDETYKKLNYEKEKTPITLSKCSRVLNLPTSVNMSEGRALELSQKIKEIIQ